MSAQIVPERQPLPHLSMKRGSGNVCRLGDRTDCEHHETDAFDPKRTWPNSLLDHLVGDGWFASHRNCSAGPFLPAAEADADTAHDDDIGPRVDRSVIGLAREVGHMADGGCDGLTICRSQALRVLRSAT